MHGTPCDGTNQRCNGHSLYDKEECQEPCDYRARCRYRYPTKDCKEIIGKELRRTKETPEWYAALTEAKRHNHPEWAWEVWKNVPGKGAWLYEGTGTYDEALALCDELTKELPKNSEVVFSMRGRPAPDYPANDEVGPCKTCKIECIDENGCDGCWEFEEHSEKLNPEPGPKVERWGYREICIISCGKAKIWDKPAKGKKKTSASIVARNAYTGPLFTLARDYAEHEFTGQEYYILSDKYGLIRPGDEIENYNVSPEDIEHDPEFLDMVQQRAKADPDLAMVKKITVLCGAIHQRIIEQAFRGVEIVNPVKGLPQGRADETPQGTDRAAAGSAHNRSLPVRWPNSRHLQDLRSSQRPEDLSPQLPPPRRAHVQRRRQECKDLDGRNAAGAMPPLVQQKGPVSGNQRGRQLHNRRFMHQKNRSRAPRIRLHRAGRNPDPGEKTPQIPEEETGGIPMKISQQKLVAFIETLKALVPECRLWITPEGWFVKAVDTANVAMVQVHVKKGSFTEYPTVTEKIEVGVDLRKISDTLRTAMNDKDSTISIALEKQNINLADGKFRYSVMQLDPTTIRKDPPPPAINLPGAVTVAGKDFLEMVRAMGIISDKIRVSIVPGGLAMYAEGDTDRLEKTLEGTGNTVTTPAAKVSALFSLDYLLDMGKSMKDVPEIAVHLAQDHPVRFDFERDGQDITFLLAPRIEEPL